MVEGPKSISKIWGPSVTKKAFHRHNIGAWKPHCKLAGTRIGQGWKVLRADLIPICQILINAFVSLSTVFAFPNISSHFCQLWVINVIRGKHHSGQPCHGGWGHNSPWSWSPWSPWSRSPWSTSPWWGEVRSPLSCSSSFVMENPTNIMYTCIITIF